MIRTGAPRDPAADLIPGDAGLFFVLLEYDDLAVVLDRVCAQPAGIELDILVLGPAAVRVISAEEQDARNAQDSRWGVVFGRPEPGVGERFAPSAPQPELRCEVRMPGLAPDEMPPRVRAPFSFAAFGATNAYVWIRPLPSAGDVVCQLTYQGLTEAVTLPGDRLRAAAAAARPIGAPPRPPFQTGTSA